MVSIPDWSRLQRLGVFSAKKPTSNRTLYYKQLEEETIKQAEERGYFLNPTRAFLEDSFLPEEDDDLLKATLLKQYEKKEEKDLSMIFHLKLSYSRLRTVGDIGLCSNLTICILQNNYIKRFDALVGCLYLMKLDLHSNQISSLPGPSFWSALQFLKFLHLHDNPIGHIENLQYLASCQNLVVLTMYDTPLSLKRNYRHHAVNSIWTLKALDNFVISDEEIIEDANFGGPFSSMHQAFAIDLCPELPETTTYENELAVMNGIISKINYVMAHYSPVLIVQRYIKGHLTRKRIGKVSRLQRKAVRKEDGKTTSKPLPASPASDVPVAENSVSRAEPQSRTGDSLKMDYDTYLLNRRPGSTAAASDTSAPITRLERESESLKRGTRKKTNIYVNLTKLQAGMLQGLNDEAMCLEPDMYTESSFVVDKTRSSDTRRQRKKRKETKADVPKRKVIKDIKQFFGPVVDTVPSPEPDADLEEIPIVDFRLNGLKKQIRFTDPTMDMILTKKEIGEDIRSAEDEYHYHMDNIPRPTITREPTMTTEQRLFDKVQGTMGLSCLQAIQQAYADREKMERKSAKMERVLAMKEQRDTSKLRIKMYKDEQRNKILHQRAGDHKNLLDTLQKRELLRLNYLDKRGDRRHRLSAASQDLKREMTFVHDFNMQNTSVSNALLRHDRQAREESKVQENAAQITSHKVVEQEQQEIVNKYLEHRTLMRQTESAMSRATLDTRMLQEANDRIMQARNRVAQQKAKSAHVTAALPALKSASIPHKNVDRQIIPNLHRWTSSIQLGALPPGSVAKSRNTIPTGVI